MAVRSRAMFSVLEQIGPQWSTEYEIGIPPVIGTSPQVGLSPNTPHQADGVRIDPPWSPPSAMVTSPAATSAALPPEEPPVECLGLCGLRIGPVAQVWLPAEKQRSSQAALPAITPPASRMRVTTVASTS